MNTRSDGLANRLEAGWSIRATSTIGHWTSLGGYLTGIIAICCFLITRRRLAAWGLTAITLLLALVAQIATLTIAPLLVSVGVIIYTLFKARRRRVGIAAAIAVATIAAYRLFAPLSGSALRSSWTGRVSGPLPWVPETVGFRIEIWTEQTIPAILSRPLTGWGNSVYLGPNSGPRPPSLIWKSPESEWLRVPNGSRGACTRLLDSPSDIDAHRPPTGKPG